MNTSEHINLHPTPDLIDPYERESRLAFWQIATEYLNQHAPQAQHYLSCLRESDDAHNIQLDSNPDYGIMIPIAANEAEKNIRGTLDALIKRPYLKPEVILYGNYGKNTPKKDQEALAQRIERIVNDYSDTPTFSALRSVVVPTHYLHKFSMVQLRKEHTDMLVADARERRLPFNYPVVTIDADLIKLSALTLSSLINPIQNEGATLTHGDSNLGYKDVPDTTVTRLAIAAEVLRRMEIRSNPDVDPYPEESCTAFSLGAYCIAEGYPPLIKEAFDESNLTSETPILIKRMKAMLQQDLYVSVLHRIGQSSTDIAPRRVDNALVTRNGRRDLEYFAKQLTKADGDPADFAEGTRFLQEVFKSDPTLDRHISTGGAYNDGFDSHETMRETNGIPASRRLMSKLALNLVLADYFGPDRIAQINDRTATPHQRIQRRVLHRYFDLDT